MKQQTLVKITYNQNVKHNRCSLLQHFFPSIFLTKYLLAKHKKKKKESMLQILLYTRKYNKGCFFSLLQKARASRTRCCIVARQIKPFCKICDWNLIYIHIKYLSF